MPQRLGLWHQRKSPAASVVLPSARSLHGPDSLSRTPLHPVGLHQPGSSGAFGSKTQGFGDISVVLCGQSQVREEAWLEVSGLGLPEESLVHVPRLHEAIHGRFSISDVQSRSPAGRCGDMSERTGTAARQDHSDTPPRGARMSMHVRCSRRTGLGRVSGAGTPVCTSPSHAIALPIAPTLPLRRHPRIPRPVWPRFPSGLQVSASQPEVDSADCGHSSPYQLSVPVALVFRGNNDPNG